MLVRQAWEPDPHPMLHNEPPPRGGPRLAAPVVDPVQLMNVIPVHNNSCDCPVWLILLSSEQYHTLGVGSAPGWVIHLLKLLDQNY